jgi:hypothetical protein
MLERNLGGIKNMPKLPAAPCLVDLKTVWVLSVVCHATAIPIAWRVLPAQPSGAWRTAWEALLASVRGVVPRSLPV